MSWNLVCQILVLTIVGGLVVSAVGTDIIKAHAKSRAEMAKAIMEVQAKAHTEGAPWDGQ